MTRLSAVMSHYDEASLVSAISRASGVAPVAVPPELMAVLQMAQRLSERSHGAFDITIGAFKGWRFDPQRPLPEHVFAYIPFGGGQRKCVGNAFALLQVKAIFCALLRRYDFALVDSARELPRRDALADPAGERALPAALPAAGLSVRVRVDLELCQGHALCQEEAPEVFRVTLRPGAFDQVGLLLERPPEALRAKVEAAARHCPTRVIKVEPAG